MLRVGLDASDLALGSGMRGIGTYVSHLVSGLAARDDVELTVLAPHGWVAPEGVTVVRVRRVSHHRVGPHVGGALLPHDIARARVDVFHSPAMSPPRRSGTPVVQTLLDLTPLVFSHPLLRADARAWHRRTPAMRRAARVVAISRSSAEQGKRLLGLDPAAVVVVPLAVGADFSPGEPSGNLEPALLMVSSWGPHKGFREAGEVLDGLVDRGHDLRLRLVGHHDAWMLAQLERDLAGCRHRERVDVVGWTPDLVDEYRSAALVLVTSRAEGFGLPAAEAAASGARVVAFDNTSLPEALDGRGHLVPDGDVGAMVAVADELLAERPPVRPEVGSAEPATHRRTWEDVVEEHVRVYADARLSV